MFDIIHDNLYDIDDEDYYDDDDYYTCYHCGAELDPYTLEEDSYGGWVHCPHCGGLLDV